MKEVTLSAVVCIDKVVWKKIEGLVNAYASDQGDIAIYNSKEIMVKCPLFKWRSTTGEYLYVKVLTDDLNWSIKPVHRLICSAFHSYPINGRINEPNHIDGNKLNNKPGNLEWLTRADNVQHAYDTGLCSQGIRIQAKNINNEEILNYNSLSKMAREWGLGRKVLKSILNKHKVTPYKGRWVFDYDDSKDTGIKRHQRKSVVFKDYRKNEIFICQDCEKAERLTGVKSGTIANRLNYKNTTLINGFVFIDLKNFDKNYNWPIFDLEQINRSIKKYTK